MEATTETTTPRAQTTTPTTDLEALKTRQRAMWGAGDYSVIAAQLPIVSELLCEDADVRAGERVLDVATGTGNTAIAAARRFAHVVGVDYVPALLARGRERATAERLEVELREGDAEALPCPSAAFDVVLSTFGVMFAPNQERTARELTRVTAPGGRIAVANWTPEGFIGEMFKTIGRHVPPPPGVKPPPLWGTEKRVRELFPTAREITFSRRGFTFSFESPRHFVEVFRRWYGPTVTAFKTLDAERQAALAEDLGALCARHHRGGRGLSVSSEYLTAVITTG